MVSKRSNRGNGVTIIAIWHRKHRGDLYAIADSRLTAGQSVLTDNAPKFSILNVRCYAAGKKNAYDVEVLNAQIGVGYAGSSSVAFSTIATVQAYCASLTVEIGGSTPKLLDISELARVILEDNYRQFGNIWPKNAECHLLIFGALPGDKRLCAFHIGTSIEGNSILARTTELPVVKDEICASFGSASDAFQDETTENMKVTGNFHPFNMLEKLIASGQRQDIGGHIQVAIATRNNVILPHVITPRPERGEHAADVTFLGRDVSTVGLVGSCAVGKLAVGPEFLQILEGKKHAGF